MHPSPVRFIILCAARTGSTMLRHLLNSHPDICCHGEVMAGALKSFVGLEDRPKLPLLTKFEQLREANPTEFMQEYVLYNGAMSAVGFKIKYEELVTPPFEAILGALCGDKNLKVIHLKRKNRLKRVLSKVAAIRVHGVFNVTKPEETPAITRFRLEPVECEQDFQDTAFREIHFANLFSDHQILDVNYEDLIKSDDALKNIQAFLQVPEFSLKTRTQKMNPDSPADVIENFAELKFHFAKTPYADYFDT